MIAAAVTVAAPAVAAGATSAAPFLLEPLAAFGFTGRRGLAAIAFRLPRLRSFAAFFALGLKAW